jgi:hypothetical protein
VVTVLAVTANPASLKARASGWPWSSQENERPGFTGAAKTRRAPGCPGRHGIDDYRCRACPPAPGAQGVTPMALPVAHQPIASQYELNLSLDTLQEPINGQLLRLSSTMQRCLPKFSNASVSFSW